MLTLSKADDNIDNCKIIWVKISFRTASPQTNRFYFFNIVILCVKNAEHFQNGV